MEMVRKLGSERRSGWGLDVVERKEDAVAELELKW